MCTLLKNKAVKTICMWTHDERWCGLRLKCPPKSYVCTGMAYSRVSSWLAQCAISRGSVDVGRERVCACSWPFLTRGHPLFFSWSLLGEQLPSSRPLCYEVFVWEPAEKSTSFLFKASHIRYFVPVREKLTNTEIQGKRSWAFISLSPSCSTSKE